MCFNHAPLWVFMYMLLYSLSLAKQCRIQPFYLLPGPALLQHDPHAGGESTLDILMERLRCDPVQVEWQLTASLVHTHTSHLS